MKLFAVYVGGEAPGANIEVHDMRFVIGERIEDTYAQLRAQWWGTPQSLHLDCWTELDCADGHRIALARTPANYDKKLFYVNVGGYDSAQFTELHQNIFVVAETEQKAKVRALKQVKHWQSFHTDEMYEAEQCYDLGATAQGWSIVLTPDADALQPSFTCKYKKIAL